MKATYKIANKKKFQVTFGYKEGKWNFRIGSFVLMSKVPGGKSVAQQIAALLHKSWHRSDNIDIDCRTEINKLLGVRTLVDHRPETVVF